MSSRGFKTLIQKDSYGLIQRIPKGASGSLRGFIRGASRTLYNVALSDLNYKGLEGTLRKRLMGSLYGCYEASKFLVPDPRSLDLDPKRCQGARHAKEKSRRKARQARE